MTESIETQVKMFKEALLTIDRVTATEIFKSCYSNNQHYEIIEKLIMKSLEEIGEDWEKGEASLAQIYMSGIICEELIDRTMSDLGVPYKTDKKIAVAVLKDSHALGKRIVCSILKASGYDFIDFGFGLSVDDIVKKTVENKADILLISTLMLPSALKVSEVVDKIREQGMNTKVIVGGAPFRLDANLWRRVNADADGKNGTDIIGIIEQIEKEGE